MKYFIAQFIPIIVVYLLLSYTKTSIIISKTILGRFLAVLAIIYYTYLNKYLGLFVCALVITYYQTDYIEGFEFIDDPILETSLHEIPMDIPPFVGISQTHIDLENNPVTKSVTNLVKNKVKIDKANADTTKVSRKSKTKEGFSFYNEEKESFNEELEGQFRKQYCNHGQLRYKNCKVRPDMTEHIFPEVSIASEKTCNVCNKGCDFSIIESKLRTEEELKPINTMP